MELWELFEAFDSRVDIKWQGHGSGEYGVFALDDKIYQIDLSKTLVPHLKTKNAVEVSFHRAAMEKEKSFSSTNDITAPTAVYGTVANALTDRFNKYDAFYFTAEERHSKNEDQYEKKARLYRILADRLSKRSGGTLYVSKSQGRTEYLISKIEPGKDSAFHDVVKEHNKKVQERAVLEGIPQVRRTKEI